MMQILSTRWPLRVRILKPNRSIANSPPNPRNCWSESLIAGTFAAFLALGDRACDDSLGVGCKYRTGWRFRPHDTRSVEPVGLYPGAAPRVAHYGSGQDRWQW